MTSIAPAANACRTVEAPPAMSIRRRRPKPSADVAVTEPPETGGEEHCSEK